MSLKEVTRENNHIQVECHVTRKAVAATSQGEPRTAGKPYETSRSQSKILSYKFHGDKGLTGTLNWTFSFPNVRQICYFFNFDFYGAI